VEGEERDDVAIQRPHHLFISRHEPLHLRRPRVNEPAQQHRLDSGDSDIGAILGLHLIILRVFSWVQSSIYWEVWARALERRKMNKAMVDGNSG
jgi:hypothetical protein